jgi:hypothetical protein
MTNEPSLKVPDSLHKLYNWQRIIWDWDCYWVQGNRKGFGVSSGITYTTLVHGFGEHLNLMSFIKVPLNVVISNTSYISMDRGPIPAQSNAYLQENCFYPF